VVFLSLDMGFLRIFVVAMVGEIVTAGVTARDTHTQLHTHAHADTHAHANTYTLREGNC
jgi:hypothetical protein